MGIYLHYTWSHEAGQIKNKVACDAGPVPAWAAADMIYVWQVL